MEVTKIIINTNFQVNKNSLEEFCRLLVPEVQEREVTINLEEETEKNISIIVEIDNQKEKIQYKNFSDKISEQKLIMIKALLLKFYKKNYKWGTLIGVRPTKIVRRLLNLEFNFQEIDKILEEIYLVSKEKRKLLLEIVEKSLKYLNNEKINVYIGIPYCPSKCKYCSFASYELRGKPGEKYDKFVEVLLEEIKLSGEFLKKENIEIESIYIGGGTPTILKEKDLYKILLYVKENFDIKNIKEFTVEAGRIDTLNQEKLDIMKSMGVQRISINPQTFNENILKELNRYFDRNLFNEIYNKAKNMDFIINMDLIIGLPNETTEDIINTLEQIKCYEIDNLTIHVLALKKASKLFKEGHNHEDINYIKIDKKIKEITLLKKLNPYYMYRQKNSLDGGENIGYSLEGKESIFNIQMIEESQSTFGLGGGAITKYSNGAFDEELEIERIVNPKDPIAYINEMKDRFNKKIILFSKK